MATFFSLNDGSLSAASTYGYSLSSYEKIDGITQLTLPLSSTPVTILETSNGIPISAVAFNIHSRTASPSGYLKMDISKYPYIYNLVDTSINNYSVSSTGGVYNTVLSPYSTGGWSGKFNGTSSYIIATDNQDKFQFGTGNFTIECWMNSTQTGAQVSLVGTQDIAGNTPAGMWRFSNRLASANGLFFSYSRGGSFKDLTLNTTNINDGNWHHVAIVRNNGTMMGFVDGTMGTPISSVDTTYSFTSVRNLIIGLQKNDNLYYKGYISNLRIVKSAVYTSNFTPSALYPLNVISNTSLLLFQDPYFRDKSSNNVTLSPTTSFEIANVAYPNSPTNTINYYPRTYGGSAYFDGSTQTVFSTLPGFNSTEDFTLEMWFYLESNGSTDFNFLLDTVTNNESDPTTLAYAIDRSTYEIIVGITSGYVYRIPSPLAANNTWNQIVTTRQNNTLRIFINGKLVQTTSNCTASRPSQRLSFGTRTAGIVRTYFVGYMSNVRFVRGSALYTTDFIPSSSSLQNVAGTELLINFNNIGKTPIITEFYPISSFTGYDSSNNLFSNISQNWQILKLPSVLSSYYVDNLAIDVSTNNNDQISLIGDDITSYDSTKLNTLNIATGTPTYSAVSFNDISEDSLYLNGSTSLSSNNNGNYNFGVNDFTIEFWMNSTTVGGGTAAWPTIIGTNPPASAGTFMINTKWSNSPASNQLTFNLYAGSGGIWPNIQTGVNICDGKWHHITLVRINGVFKMFIDGIKKGPDLSSQTTISVNSSYLRIGQSSYGYYYGNISSLRIAKKAIYTQDFIPPSQYDITQTPETVFLMRSGKRFNKTLLTSNSLTPTINDTVHIGGALKNSNTESRIVTADTLTINKIFIHNQGTLTFPLTSNKTLTVVGSGGLQVTSGGTLNIGTSSEYIPLSTTHNLILSTSNNIDIHNGGIFNVYGSPKISNVYLLSNSISGQTTFTVNIPISSDWSVGDTLVFTPNTSQRTSFDVLILSSFLSDSTFTTTTSSVYSHHALSSLNFFPTTVVNLTNKNVKIKGGNSSLRISNNNSFINVVNAGLEIKDILNQYSHNHSISSCVLSGSTYKLNSTNKTLSGLSLSNNVFYKPSSTINFNLASLSGFSFTNNTILSSVANGMEIIGASISAMNISNNTIIAPSNVGLLISNINSSGTLGCKVYNANGNGIYLYGTNTGIDTFNLYAYNGNSNGIYIDNSLWAVKTLNFSDIIASNNTTTGFKIFGNSTNILSAITLNINGLTASNNINGAGFEVYNICGNLSSMLLNNNKTYGMRTSIGNGATTIDGLTSILSNSSGFINPLSISSSTNYNKTLIKNSVLSANPSNTSSVGLVIDSSIFKQFQFNNSKISTATPISLNTTYNICEGSYIFNNSYLGDTPLGTGIVGKYQSDVGKTAGFVFNNLNNIPNYNKSYVAAGSRTLDYTTQSLKDSDKPSERLTPTSTTTKLRSGSKYVIVDKNDAPKVSVYVRKSILSDGVVYNGNYPRLILKRNAAVGINSDIVISQLDESKDVSGFYVALSGTMPHSTDNGVYELYVDCDGNNGGYINIDNWNTF